MLVINNKSNFKKWLNYHNYDESVTKELGNGNIYIDCIFTDYLAAFLPRFLFANGLREENSKYRLIAICNKLEHEVNEIAKSYGIRTISIRKKMSMLKAIFTVVIIFLFRNSSKAIYSLSYRNVEIGKYLADFLIRQTYDLFTLEKIRFKDLKKASAFYWAIFETDKIFRKAPPNLYLVLETGYWYGPVIKLAESYGARIVQCTSGNRILELGYKMNRPINPIDSWNYEVHRGVEKIDAGGIDYRTWIDEYYQKRRLGLTDKDAADAYANKVILTRDEWIRENSVDCSKKNIVIMAHCFSDDANTTTSRSIYRDYYQWLVSTLEIIQNIDNVNWLLRAHPGRGFYNEGDFIYGIFKKYANKENIIILDDSLSSESLYNIIDGAVTVVGTCGLEFSSFGIPVVCAGLASYGGFGFTIEPLTEQEYIECLNSMDKIRRLSDEKIDIARKVSYAYFNLRKPADIFDELFETSLNKDKNVANDIVVNKMMELFERGISEKDSFFYKKAKEEWGTN